MSEIDRAAAHAAGLTNDSNGSSISRVDGNSPPNYALGLADNQIVQDQNEYVQPRQGYEFPPLQKLRVTNRA